MVKICKQCGRPLPIENYRKNTPRGKGIYKTEQGYHTVCKECEAINVRAISLEKIVDKSPAEQEIYNKLVVYYQTLEDRGLGIASAVAGRYLGKDTLQIASPGHSITDKLDNLIGDMKLSMTEQFMVDLRKRTFANVDAAWAHYDNLKSALQTAGLREEAARLLDEWEAEEDA